MRVDYGDFVGIPWATGGRERSGVDCWGLLCVFYREAIGWSPPLFSDRRDGFAEALETDFADWTPCRREPGAGVLLRRPGGLHVAIITDRDAYLNIEADRSSVIDRHVAGAVVGYWKPNA